MSNRCLLKFTIVEINEELFEKKLQHVESIMRKYIRGFWRDEEHVIVKKEFGSHNNAMLYSAVLSCEAKLKEWFEVMMKEIATPPLGDNVIFLFSQEDAHYYEKVLEVSKGGLFHTIYRHRDDVLCETCGSWKHYDNW